MENNKNLMDIFYKRINLNKGISIINYGTGVGKTHSTIEAIIKYLKENTYNNEIKDEDKNIIIYLSINNTSVNDVYNDFVKKIKEKNNESNFALSDKEINKISVRLLSKPEVFKEKIKPALEFIKNNTGNSKFNTNIKNSKEFETFERIYDNYFKNFYKKIKMIVKKQINI